MAKKDGKESLIGKVIYGFLMFAPLIAVGTSCAYSIFNKNATEQMTRTEVVNPTELIVGELYHFENKELLMPNTSATIYFSNYYNLQAISTPTTSPYDRKELAIDSGSYYYFSFNTELYNYFIGSFDFICNGSTGDYTYLLDYITYTKTYTETRDLRNTFYYSLDRVQEEDVFKWAKNNEIYTGLKAVTDGLTIQTEFVPMILSYWLIISVIYFMYDILLIIFHVLHNNIHKLESM